MRKVMSMLLVLIIVFSSICFGFEVPQPIKYQWISPEEVYITSNYVVPISIQIGRAADLRVEIYKRVDAENNEIGEAVNINQGLDNEFFAKQEYVAKIVKPDVFKENLSNKLNERNVFGSEIVANKILDSNKIINLDTESADKNILLDEMTLSNENTLNQDEDNENIEVEVLKEKEDEESFEVSDEKIKELKINDLVKDAKENILEDTREDESNYNNQEGILDNGEKVQNVVTPVYDEVDRSDKSNFKQEIPLVEYSLIDEINQLKVGPLGLFNYELSFLEPGEYTLYVYVSEGPYSYPTLLERTVKIVDPEESKRYIDGFGKMLPNEVQPDLE